MGDQFHYDPVVYGAPHGFLDDVVHGELLGDGAPRDPLDHEVLYCPYHDEVQNDQHDVDVQHEVLDDGVVYVLAGGEILCELLGGVVRDNLVDGKSLCDQLDSEVPSGLEGTVLCDRSDSEDRYDRVGDKVLWD